MMNPAMTEEKGSKVLIGTSGFSYQDWKGPFYPDRLPDREMLVYYSSSFPTVEINSTFYAIPQPRNMAAMVTKTGGKMEFVVKANQDLTHNRDKMEEALPRFKEALKPFQSQRVLGCVLLQFPYSFHNTIKNRNYLGMLKEKMGEIPVVVEFRNRWWIQDRIFEFLRRKGIGYCCVDEPRLPDLPPPVVLATSEIGYIRFHGRNIRKWWKHETPHERYDYEYTEGELQEWAEKITGLLPIVTKLYVFFNNHPRGQAIRNALTMMALLKPP
jgi:uncharacterized protein YecE (DUF72 family)